MTEGTQWRAFDPSPTTTSRRESPKRESQRHYKARAGATFTLGEVLDEHGEEIPDEARQRLLDLHDALNPKTDD